MAVEYIMLLLISSIILVGAFGFSTGPVGMFKGSSPYLAFLVQERLATGTAFAKKSGLGWKSR